MASWREARHDRVMREADSTQQLDGGRRAEQRKGLAKLMGLHSQWKEENTGRESWERVEDKGIEHSPQASSVRAGRPQVSESGRGLHRKQEPI